MKLQEVLREPWVVVDGNDGNKVIAQASNKQAAERIIGSSQLPPLSVKDKSKLRVVKVKKKQHLGWPLNEADYKLYHNSFTSASQAAYDYAHKKGYTISDDEWFNSVSTGKTRGRPSVGQTNSFHVALEKNGKPQRKQLHFQVYGMESGKYELNMYIN